MVSDIKVLQQMIRNAAKIALTEHSGKKKIILTEPQCLNSSVTISGLPDDIIVIKADSFKSPDSIFNGSCGECKRADFIIVADSGDKKTILCVEMKMTKGSEQEIIKQLTGTLCLVSYIQKIGQLFWNRQEFLKGYLYRFVSIGHTSMNKGKTRMERPSTVHDRPEKMLKIACPNYLIFDHLAGGKN